MGRKRPGIELTPRSWTNFKGFHEEVQNGVQARSRFEEAPSIERVEPMRKSPKFSPEVMERAVRMVFDAKDQYPSQWAAIESIAGKIGCTAETLCKWVRQGERDSGVRPGPTTAEQQRIKELEREVRELRKTNEVLKLASAYFAQAEFDRQLKK